MWAISTAAAPVLLMIAWVEAANSPLADKVLFNTVMAITFLDSHMTITRHNSSLPQLNCVGGSAGCREEYLPMAILCMNEGKDKHSNTIQWKCSYDNNDLEENGIEMQQGNISCEGYNYPNDPYIVKGSCSLEYKLNWRGDGLDEHESFDDILSWTILIVVGVAWILLILCCLALKYCAIPSKSPPSSADAVSDVSYTHHYEGYLPVDDSSASSTPDALTIKIESASQPNY